MQIDSLSKHPHPQAGGARAGPLSHIVIITATRRIYHIRQASRGAEKRRERPPETPAMLVADGGTGMKKPRLSVSVLVVTVARLMSCIRFWSAPYDALFGPKTKFGCSTLALVAEQHDVRFLSEHPTNLRG
jgi:hypothetical protein